MSNSQSLLNNRKLAQQGVGLIEVLVSLLIVAIAIIGLISLQIRALQHNSEAMMFVNANNLAADIFERMRANPIATIDQLAYQRDFDDPILPLNQVVCDLRNRCNSAQIAQWDLALWANHVARLLESGKAKVAMTPIEFSGKSYVDVTVYLQYESLFAEGDESALQELIFESRI